MARCELREGQKQKKGKTSTQELAIACLSPYDFVRLFYTLVYCKCPKNRCTRKRSSLSLSLSLFSLPPPRPLLRFLLAVDDTTPNPYKGYLLKSCYTLAS